MGDFNKLQLYCELLLKWNAKINLIGRATITEIMERHVLDCLQLSEHIVDKNLLIADLGTGAGLPGLILAIDGFKNMSLIESDEKKCVFLREARRVLELDCEIINQRIEKITDRTYDVIVSRALAPLELLLQLSDQIRSEQSKCFFLKGISYKDEIIQAQKKMGL